MLQPVKIPQNVYVEDRIIGPISLRQLIICGIGAGIGYTLYSMATKAGYVGIHIIIITWSPALVAAVFAFLKINDLSLFNIILLFIESMNKPSTRYWVPHPGISVNILTGSAYANKEIAEKKENDSTQLGEIMRQMENKQKQLATIQHTDSPESEHEKQPKETSKEYSVDPGRVHTDILETQKSIDGVSTELKSFEHIFKQT